MKDKSFNEHLNPLWRFLRSSLGRPWDKVYSEIRSRVDGRGVLGNHVLDHLSWEVSVNTIQEGKRILAKDRFGRVYPVEGFYVHPKTGLLLEAKRIRWKRAERKYPVRWVEGPTGERYQRFDGLWFAVEYVMEEGRSVPVYKLQCNSKKVRQIASWIEAAERGKRGFERGADTVRVPRTASVGQPAAQNPSIWCSGPVTLAA